MIQYLTLLEEIKKKGTLKPAARAGMPGTISRFGYQFRQDLAEGFPLLTTKKVSWKNVVTELLWFLRGDTNIKYLVDNGCNIWNEDAYNYYKKIGRKHSIPESDDLSFEEFIQEVKDGRTISLYDDYPKLGDCGFQYGRVWRTWEGLDRDSFFNSDVLLDEEANHGMFYKNIEIDQIANVIKSLKETPESRRHIVTAIDPAHDQDLALYWCHAMFQFNCRPMTHDQKFEYFSSIRPFIGYRDRFLDEPHYYLDCQLYQRSADVILGVPFNIASYALLTHIIAKIVNMVPGEFIHTFGDVHIYENHMDAVEEQLKREPRSLPTLITDGDENDWQELGRTLDFSTFDWSDFNLKDYNPHPKIEAKLSTGLK